MSKEEGKVLQKREREKENERENDERKKVKKVYEGKGGGREEGKSN